MVIISKALVLVVPFCAVAHQVEIQTHIGNQTPSSSERWNGEAHPLLVSPNATQEVHAQPTALHQQQPRGQQLKAKAVASLKAETTTPNPFAKGATAAEMSGVQTNVAGDLPVFLTGLATNAGTMAVFFIAFSILRRKIPMVYAGNVVANRVPFEPSDSFFGWASASFALRMEDIIEYAGLDQAMLLEFAHFAMGLFAWLMVPLLFVMGPLHWIFGGDRSGDDHLSKLGMANVVDNQPWLYWVHCGLVWFVVVSVQRAVYKAMGKFLERRKEWLKKLPAPRSTTVLVENIPLQHCTDKKVKAYFDGVFESHVVESVHVIKHTGELAALVKEKEGYDLKLEEALHKEKTTGQRPTIMRYTGSSDDAINYWTEQSKEASQRVKEARKRIEEQVAQGDPQIFTSNAFVTFKSRRDSEMALKVTYTADDDEFVCEIPPDPADVIYSDLQKDVMHQQVSTVLGYSMIALIFWAYMPAVIGIAYITNLENLANHFPAFRSMAEDQSTTNMWNAMMGSLALELFLSFVPTFFMYIFQLFFVLKAQAWLQHRIQNWYFWFLVLYVLLVTAVGSSVIVTLDEIIESPTYIFYLLATTMPFATHFYLNFIPLQWVTHAQNMLRMVPLFKFYAFKALFGEEQAKEMAEPETQDYYGIGSRCARHSFLVVLTLVYCELTPLIIVLGFINMLTVRLVYGYLVIFAEIRKPDLGGAFWVTNMMNIQRSMAIYISLMSGVLCFRFDNPWPCAIAGSSFVYWYISFSRFPGAFRWESLCFEDICDEGTASKRTATSSQGYVQKELLPN